jgi:hypothetical protein
LLEPLVIGERHSGEASQQRHERTACVLEHQRVAQAERDAAAERASRCADPIA